MSNEYQDWKRDEIFELKQELIRTRKALNIAVDALDTFARIPNPIAEVAKVKLYTIKELEQKTILLTPAK